MRDWIIQGCGNSIIPEDNAVRHIKSYAFQNCYTLTEIKIPKNITSIGKFAFNRCKNLVNVEISNGPTCIDSYAFSDCESLTEVELPDSITKIEDCAFRGCTNLRSIKIPASVTCIEGYYAFEGCSQVTIVTSENSCAEKYAREHGLAVELI